MEEIRKIACVTATRADYPRVKSVLHEITERKTLELHLIVTGAHLEKKFGNTVSEIEEDGYHIAARVPMYDDDNTPFGMANAAARCAAGIARAFKEIDPDLVLLTVDRVETIAAAQSAALMNFPIAHIQGGEVTGTIDESIRHAVTKLSHYHFPATEDAGRRIVAMGERSENVHVVGCPYLDLIESMDFVPRARVAELCDFDAAQDFIIFAQHPVTTEYGESLAQCLQTINALERFPDLQVVAIYSNADAGSGEIIQAIEGVKRFKVFRNLNERVFLSLMKEAVCMVGNSSAGIREAPSLGLPVVNVGTRQAGRLRAANVIDTDHDVDAIAEAIGLAISDDFRHRVSGMDNPYGDGKSASRIVDVLERCDIDKTCIQKRITI